MEASDNSPKMLFNDMLEAIESNRLPLPTQPEIAIQIQEISQNPHVTIDDLNEVLVKDPGLTARIMRIANSPLIRGHVTITTLKIALSRLGTQFVANMAIGLAMEQLFHATSKVVDVKMKDAWRESGQIASVSFVLANHTKICPPEEAMLAGLLQDIGLLPMLTYADKHQRVLKDMETFLSFLHKYSSKLGTSILTSWQFPRGIACVPQNVNNMTRTNNVPDMSDLVLIAKIYVMSKSEHPIALIDPTQISAYERLKLPPVRDLAQIPELENSMSKIKNIFA